MIKTSQTSPLRIAEIGIGGRTAMLGLTLCPGKKDAARGWNRDLREDLQAIRAWGAGTVVTLIEDHELSLLEVGSLGRDVRRLGMDWVHLPIPDVDVPQAAFDSLWPLAGRMLHERIDAGERILIHCRGGRGRSGLVAGRLLVERGCDPRVAIHRVRAARPGAIETAAQERHVLQSARIEPLGDREARVLGSLLAGAVGDAAGYLVEFDDIGAIRRQHGPDGMRLSDLFLEPIPVSDDTQMTLFTLEGLLAARSAGTRSATEIEHFIREAYLDWFGTQRPVSRAPVGQLARDPLLRHNRAPGMTCISALQRGGGSWASLPGTPLNDSKGCGTVMRTAPIGWIPDWTAEEAFDLGIRASAITHSHPTGYIAGGAMAAMVHLLVEGESLAEAARRARELAVGRAGGAETAAAIDAAMDLAASPKSATPELVETLGGGWIAEEALAIGLYAALRGECMARTLEIAINHSGDSDSTASIAGQLRGAAEGLKGVPFDLLRKVDLLGPMLGMAGRMGVRGNIDAPEEGRSAKTQESIARQFDYSPSERSDQLRAYTESGLEMTESDTYTRLRDQYRPDRIRLLIIAESPPEPRDGPLRFFYSTTLSPHDNLYRGVSEALYGHEEAFDVNAKKDNLESMKRDGVWLIDAVDTPINGKSQSQRRRAIRESAPRLVRTCMDLKPSAGVLICHTVVFDIVSLVMKNAGVKLLHDRALPFPLGNLREQFVFGARDALTRAGWWM